MSSESRRRQMARVSFGQRVRSLRQAKGMSLADLAWRVGYEEPASLGNIELGIRSPSRDMVVELCWEFAETISREERNMWLVLLGYEPLGPKQRLGA